MNRNTLIGAGLIVGGAILAIRAKRQGKFVPIIHRVIPTGAPAQPAPEGASSFNGTLLDRGWDY